MPEFVSVKEAATLLGISRQRVQELITTGKLPAQKLLGGQVWMIRESAILHRLQQGKVNKVRDQLGQVFRNIKEVK